MATIREAVYPTYIVGMESFSARELARLAVLITEHAASLRRAGTIHGEALTAHDVNAIADDAELLSRAASALLSLPLGRHDVVGKSPASLFPTTPSYAELCELEQAVEARSVPTTEPLPCPFDCGAKIVTEGDDLVHHERAPGQRACPLNGKVTDLRTWNRRRSPQQETPPYVTPRNFHPSPRSRSIPVPGIDSERDIERHATAGPAPGACTAKEHRFNGSATVCACGTVHRSTSDGGGA